MEKYTKFIVNDILNNYNFRKLIAAELNFEEEIQIVAGPPVDVFVKPTLNVAENKK